MASKENKKAIQIYLFFSSFFRKERSPLNIVIYYFHSVNSPFLASHPFTPNILVHILVYHLRGVTEFDELWSQKDQVQFLALPLVIYVTVGKLHDVCKPRFPHL